MQLSPYHQRYISRSEEDIAERIAAKESEFKQVFDAISYAPIKQTLKVAVLGCGVRYFVNAHKEILEKLLQKETQVTTFDITIDHLEGEEGVVQHDCTLPLPGAPYDITYSSILLMFIPEEKQWDLLLNSYEALEKGGIAIHLVGNEKDNETDVKDGYYKVPLGELKKKINEQGIDFQQISIFTGPNLQHEEYAWIFRN